VTDSHLAAAGVGGSLSAALEEGRLLETDFSKMKDLVHNNLGGTDRFAYPARVMFAIPPGGGAPRVCAIQLTAEPQDDSPVFSPDMGWAWKIAKVQASVADCIYGAFFHHHAGTHLLAEPFCVAMHRELSDRHPVHRLISPHFMGTLSINHVGSQTVFAPHGVLEWIGGATHDSIRSFCRSAVESFDFEAEAAPVAWARRGVDDAELIPDFPFRDDAQLIWQSIEDWVSAYLRLAYSDDESVRADPELQAWIRVVGAQDGGRLNVPASFSSIAALTRTLTHLIYRVSPLHSAMNFPVSSEIAFVPNLPFAAYAPRPTKTEGLDRSDLLATLPPMDAAQRQFDVAYLLGESRFGTLGDYQPGWFGEGAFGDAAAEFRAALDRAETTINERNRTRRPYIHLLPSRIAPSINI
jgi:arachidonate 15-lipoxygenase